MSRLLNRLAQFGPYVFHVGEGDLLRGLEPVNLTPRAIAILRYLIQNRDHLVSKQELQTQLWPNVHIADDSINKHMSDLRLALGVREDGSPFIETKYKRGWRFVGPVREIADPVLENRVDAVASVGTRNDELKAAEAIKPSPQNGTPPAPSTAPAENKNVSTQVKQPALTRIAVIIATCFCALTMLIALLSNAKPEPKVLKFVELTNDGRAKRGPLLTDGKRIFFVEYLGNSDRIVSIPISGGEAVPLAVPMPHLRLEDISPDRQTLLIKSSDPTGDQLWTLPISGGEPRHLIAMSEEASWAPDGRTLAISRMNSLGFENPNDLHQTSNTTVPGEIRSIRWSPLGSTVRVSVFDPKAESMSIWEVEAKGGPATKLTLLTGGNEFAENGAWSRDGRYFFYQAGTHLSQDLWAVSEFRSPFGLGDAKPFSLTHGLGSWSWPLALADNSGVVAINQTTRSELVRLNPASGAWEPVWDSATAYEVDYSRNRDWVVFTHLPDHTLWKCRPDGSARVQLTDSHLEAHQAHWAPEGRRIAFMGKSEHGKWRVYVMPSDGGPSEELLARGDDQGVPTWSSDGRYIVFGDLLGRKAKPEMSIHLLDVATRALTDLDHSNGLWSPRWSPDGKLIAAITSDSRAIRICRWPGSDWKEIARTGFIDNVTWSADSRLLYFNSRREPQRFELFRVNVLNSKLERLADLQNFPMARENWFGVAPDGTPLAARGVLATEIWQLKCALP